MKVLPYKAQDTIHKLWVEFYDWHFDMHNQDKEKYPLVMDISDWLERFYDYAARQIHLEELNESPRIYR